MKWPKSFYISATFIALLLLIALFANFIATQAFDEQNLELAFQLPSSQHFFGTDYLGRDLFSRLVYGCRISMSIALITALSSILIGVIYGSISGYMGGWTDKILMRIVDILYTLPSLVIIILVMLIFGRDLMGIYISLTLTGWLGTARLMRAQVMSWKQRPFVEAASAIGVRPFRKLLVHILPNCIAPIIVELSYQIPTNVLAEAYLSFLGVGIQPPTPSWGVLAEEGWRALNIYPHLSIFPGVLIFSTMLAFNLLGDALRDKLDPFLSSRR